MEKLITLDIVKKNRVYFKCINSSGYEVKLKITPESECLELGKQDLFVKDVSVRTKYGVDVIYELYRKTEKKEGIVTLYHRYNTILIKECRKLNGKFDSSSKNWVFSKIVEEEVENLDFQFNSDLVQVEIKAKKDIFECNDSVDFLGYPIAKAHGRDSGAKLCEDVYLINGRINSGGSVKNWGTFVDEGTVFRLLISKNLLDSYTQQQFEISILEEKNNT